MSNGARDLKVWQESVALAGDVIRSVRSSVRRETKCVSDSIMASALSIGSHIADGYAAHTIEDQRSGYMSAKRALLRLETELAAARHADMIPATALSELLNRTGLVSRLLGGYVAYLDRQISDAAPRTSAPRASVNA